MRHKAIKPPTKKYIRRVTSNGEDVYPTVCATQYKGVQQQMDKGGYYILEYVKYKRDAPLTTCRKI